LHHELHVALTGERDGYYTHYGSAAGLADALRIDARHVVYAQNHDQVGNRPSGDRLPAEKLRVAAAALALSTGTPLLFMGEEYGERSPFRFFTDHDDPAIAEATREGRRREFESFAGFAGELPDPQHEATFRASKLSRVEEPGVRELYRELLRQRRERR